MSDEIEYKLESKNPVLIAHAISKLFETVKRKTDQDQERNNDISKVPEFKFLLSKLDTEDAVVSISVCQALIALVEDGSWDVGAALSTFTSSLSSTKNHVAIAAAISRLLVLDIRRNKSVGSVYPFTLHVPQHPFIVILNRDQYSGQTIINEMKWMMNHPDPQIRENCIETLRPVFLYILCNPTTSSPAGYRQQAWDLLIHSSRAVQLQIETSLWSCVHETNLCLDTNYKILDLARTVSAGPGAGGNKEYYRALLPVIVSLTIYLLRQGLDPRANFDALNGAIDGCDDCTGGIILALMTEIIVICPAIYLYSSLQICASILKKMSCQTTVLYALVASLLKWMAYPSVLCTDALNLARDLIDDILTKVTSEPSGDASRMSSKLFDILSRSNYYVRFYTESIECLESQTTDTTLSWLNHISNLPIDLRGQWKFLLCGLFLESNDLDTIKLTCLTLVEIAREMKSFGSHLLCLILYRLTRSRSNSESKYLLLVLPELITDKENMPIITHTFDTLLNSDKQPKYFAIELYLKAFRKEPRCYRFLSTAIIRSIKNDRSWYSDATCARAMCYICENHSEHGEKLVPLLSEILNRCTDQNGGTASALALKSISALCKFGVIGVCSTWRVLAPKMEKERRIIVLESLCEFFQKVPSFPSQFDEEYDKLTIEILFILWKYVSSNDTRLVESALTALASFPLEQIPLKTLPEEFRRDLVLPAAYKMSHAPGNEPVKPEEVLPYIPGTCWIKMLQNVKKTSLRAAGNVLISFIREEVSNFRSGIYIWPQGEPCNFKYLPERSVIRSVGEYLRRSDKSDANNHLIILECLRIFAQKYPKPLPNVNWSFLEETFLISPQAKEYTLLIASRHSVVSLSARTFIENYLQKYESTENSDQVLQTNAYLIPLYSNLEDLCHGIQPKSLKPFLEVTLDKIVKKMDFDENAIELFNCVMAAYVRALKSSDIQEGNNTLLSTILEKLFDEIDLTQAQFKTYFLAVSELSVKHLERIISPEVWWEITNKKLENAIAVGSELVLRKPIENPLSWLNDLIKVASTNASVQPYCLRRMQMLFTEMRFEKFIPNWVLDLMDLIQGLLVEPSTTNPNQIRFYLDVLFVAIISLAGVDCMLPRRDLLITEENTRIRLYPLALTILVDRQDWCIGVPQIMEWLHYMRTSSIPHTYETTFHNSLLSLKHHPYYKVTWTKFLSTRTIIDT